MKILKQNWGRVLTGLAAAVLTATTTLKDNVHFGSVEITNPQTNQYAWSLVCPEIDVVGEQAKGNLYSIGLLIGEVNISKGVNHQGNSTGVGLIGGVNDYGRNSTHTENSTGVGLIGGVNRYDTESRITGDISAYGLLSNAADKKGLLTISRKGLENYVVKGKSNSEGESH